VTATAWTPLDESLARLERIASPYTGIVRRTYDILRSPDDARLHRVSAEVTEGTRLVGDDLSAIRDGSGGYHHDRRRATAAALAETAERYSGCFVPERELATATATELGSAAVPPARFALFHPEQLVPGFPFVPFTDATRIRWTRGTRLGDGSAAWLPAQLVYLGWSERGSPEPRIGFSTSNGLACGATFEEAAVSALLEALERDAFMITWYARLSHPLLDWSGDADLARHAARYFEPTRLRFAAVDLSAFWNVPTVAGVVHAAGLGALGVGAAAATTVQEAWRKALAEAFSVRTWGRVRVLDGAATPAARSDVRTFADHVVLYAHPEHASRAAFLDASTARRAVADVPPLPASTPAAALGALVETVHAAGYAAYAVDVTSPDVREAGLIVVKAVVPELCALDVDYRARFLGGRRLYEAPATVGLARGALELADLNPDPHPFP
jgi:ribosomal protein S12 methylthiotransferase accessory factor